MVVTFVLVVFTLVIGGFELCAFDLLAFGLGMLSISFETRLIEWRGPAPFVFAPIPETDGAEIRRIAKAVTYGWGVIPVEATIGNTLFRTSLFPKGDTYLLPVKKDVRTRAGLTVGDLVAVSMTVQPDKK